MEINMLTPKAQMRKARRASKSIVGGDALLEFLQREDVLELLKEGIVEEVPPVSKISDLLMEELGEEVDLKALPVRQYIGYVVKAVLADDGYRVMETGVRIEGDQIFRSGSTYEAVEHETSDGDLLTRFIATLDRDELERARELVEEALGD
ncbi:hypothetical protein X734_12625 [Mesorhizobium sp. L2C084A000]|nr:hypothetical protein X734_12625 [Mesorhizobium sp. L2C084A000]